MRVVPDTVLENMTCRKCCKYLTVSPIGVHPEGGNVCGRCLYGKATSPTATLFEYGDQLGADDFSIPLSLLGYATVPEVLFPCVNRFEGCDRLLAFADVRSHERSCVYKKYQCPMCLFSGVGSQLIEHFKTAHRKYLSAEKPRFVLHLDTSFSDTYLYRSDDILCLVRVRYVKEISQFAFDTLCLGSTATERVGRIRVEFRVPAGGGTAYEEYVLLSDALLISRDNRFNMTFKINSFRFDEAKKVLCVYKIVCVQ